ncbi:low molecular weight protein-tyrosine-phosphatase [Flagellimonas beolgyonensis]|uniref:low molecular weight protein-tyrosine-phosphatase n=1 Tax=Flagellimonas beolgyonensis TaxID=864064 RepID=UPI000F8F0585|nr:low molecular weight protein-tyrosine-phosphatase [Allomuricauda beolgyonensis]
MKTKVLMVCLGNICRSPLAEGILKSKVDPDKVFVDSAGTAGYHVGNPPDHRSVAVARQNGLDISNQRCRKFSSIDFLEFDHIYVMDKSNFSNVIQLANTEDDRAKVKLLLEEIDFDISEVPDPYYGGADGFEKVYQMIDRACEAIAKKLT